ncbi:MAG: DUF937 domain-containing protein [Lapillicoccus sp.]
MSEIEQILSQVPMDQVAAALGVDRGEAEQATRAAIPALLGGMHANAQDPAGAASLASALQQHDGSALGAPVDQIDTQDGQQIVQNVFGAQTNDVVARLGGATPGNGSSLVSKLLPILAPIVMAYLARKMQGGTAGATTGDSGVGGGVGGGGLGDILGSVLGGAGGAQTQPGLPTGQGGMGDILGGVLGGLLGGGKR